MNIFVKTRQHRLVIFAGAMLLGLMAIFRVAIDSHLVEDGLVTSESNGLRQLSVEPSNTLGAENLSVEDLSVEKPRIVDDDLDTNTSHSSFDSIEASLTANNEIDLDWYGENNGRGDVFEKLVRELRNMSSLDVAEHRAKYEELFLSPPQTQNGSVTLQTLECGKNLCVVEFSGNDDALLNAYAKTVFTSETFEASAIFQPYWDSGKFPDIYRRYIFSHNSEINTIRSSDRQYVFSGKDRVSVMEN